MARTPIRYSRKAKYIPPKLKFEMPSSEKSTNESPISICEPTVALSQAIIKNAVV